MKTILMTITCMFILMASHGQHHEEITNKNKWQKNDITVSYSKIASCFSYHNKKEKTLIHLYLDSTNELSHAVMFDLSSGCSRIHYYPNQDSLYVNKRGYVNKIPITQTLIDKINNAKQESLSLQQ